MYKTEHIRVNFSNETERGHFERLADMLCFHLYGELQKIHIYSIDKSVAFYYHISIPHRGVEC